MEEADICFHNGPGVCAAGSGGFPVDRGLHAEADAGGEYFNHCFKEFRADLAGCTLDRDFGGGVDNEAVADGFEYLEEKLRLERAGGAAAEIDAAQPVRELPSILPGTAAGAAKLVAEARHIALVLAGREDARGEVAVGALCAAERDGDIETERAAHTSILPAL